MGLDPQSSDGVISVYINEKIYHIIDQDGDGEIDVFYDSSTTVFSQILIDDKKILIDMDQDGAWDYYYELDTKVLAKYHMLEESQDTQDMLSFFSENWILFLVFFILIIGILVGRKYHVESSEDKTISSHSLFKNSSFKTINHNYYISKDKKRSISVNKIDLRPNKITNSKQLDNDDDEKYITGSSLKNVFDDALRSSREDEGIFNSDSYMIKNRLDDSSSYNRDIARQRYHDYIVNEIDDLIDKRFKEKIQEN